MSCTANPPQILIVEDNPVNAQLLSRRLSRQNYAVVVAETGEAALHLAQTQSIQLILMDISLPTLDGWETTRRLRAMPETTTIPIIALTAHDSAEDRQKCLKAGCDDYDTKPLQIQRLLDKISRLLNP